MHPNAARLVSLVDVLAAVVRGLRVVLAVFGVGAVLGGLLLFGGLLRFGIPLFLNVVLSVCCFIPAAGLGLLWRGLESATTLPDHVRSLPTSQRGLTDDFSAVAAALAEAKERPRTPGEVFKSLKASKQAYDALSATSVGGVLEGAAALHPAGLTAGAVTSLWALGYFAVGLLVNLASLLFA